ncbi:TonB-dependent receptor domain-containing protein [Campylobacter gastrosuis]|uniref:TonB-dependent receptor n=1 Tax=Campylobacter gastrosuis TaxID=2974576 RepID=A0ABT7HRQ5_9BACT|nr:TonB-dependent receptor [Campylobacter gastrosuis]MDL0089592.1 TonB-dependent receptor [Campylobacter gastrosuis]
MLQTYVGFEFSANYALNEMFNFGTNYTYINAKYKNSDEKIYNLPKHKGFIYADIYFTPNLSLYISQELSPSRYSSVSGRYVNDAKISGFGVTNLKLSYKTAKKIELSAGISNVFDKNYEYQDGYLEEGRTFFANVNYKF